MENGIRVYNFPKTGLEKEDMMREKQPFAVVGSNTVTEDKNGRKVRGRKYVWGTVDVENAVTSIFGSFIIINVFRIIAIFLL